MGSELAKEIEVDADFVIDVPRSGKPYARGFHKESGLPYLSLLEKKNSERSFIQSTKEDRERSITENLYLRDSSVIRDKAVAVVDDSVIRGNVIRRVVELLKKAGARRIYFLSGIPPIGREENCYCCYGVDMPPEDEFIMRKFETPEKISRYISRSYNIDFELHYLSEDGLFKVLPGKEENYCSQCITGKCPIADLKK